MKPGLGSKVQVADRRQNKAKRRKQRGGQARRQRKERNTQMHRHTHAL